MAKIKYLIILLLTSFLVFVAPIIVNATDTFTTTDGIVVKKMVTGFSNGNIELDISNISLSSEGNYEWGIGTNPSADIIKKWYVLGDVNSSKKTAKLTLSVEDKDSLDLLRKTDTAFLFIKNTNDNSLIINGLEVDLTLPPLYAFDYDAYSDGNYYITGGNLNHPVTRWGGATYNIRNTYYKFEKITDKTLLTNYKKALADGTNLSNVFSITKTTVESVENWTACTNAYSNVFTLLSKEKVPTEQGTYYLWLKAKDTDSKTVYGCLIIDIDGNGPTVSRIYVSSPTSGTYKTGQTVKIRVEFSEEIKGTSFPTLKIRFGESPVRSLTNGTIVNEWLSGNYIEYSYNIQDSDKGQLSTVELSGGNIKDTSDNDAKLSCPVITGNTIKANVEGTITNNTDNQDKTNNTGTDNKNNGNTNNNVTTNKGTSNNPTTANGKKDNTIATGPIPRAGLGFGLIFAIITLFGASIFVYNKYSKLKDIK